MAKFHQLLDKKNGTITYNKENVKNILDILFDGRYLVTLQRIDPKSDVKDYRRCYFAKLDELARDAGEDRYSLHAIIKDQVMLPMMEETPELFADGAISTGSLTLEGWTVFIERFDLWSFTEYGIILQ